MSGDCIKSANWAWSKLLFTRNISINCLSGVVDRRKAFSNPNHRESPTGRKQDLNVRRTSFEALLDEGVQ